MYFFHRLSKENAWTAWILIQALAFSQISPAFAWTEETLRGEQIESRTGLEELKVHLRPPVSAPAKPSREGLEEGWVGLMDSARWKEAIDPNNSLIQSFSGIRALVGEKTELSNEHKLIFARYGYLFARHQIDKLLKASPGQREFVFVVGQDPRPSGAAIREAQMRGVFVAAQDIGKETSKLIEVRFVLVKGKHPNEEGVVPTPFAESLVRAVSADGGMIITASHNPLIWNGVKYPTAVEEPEEFLVKGGILLPAGQMAGIVRSFRNWAEEVGRDPATADGFRAALDRVDVSASQKFIDRKFVLEWAIREARQMWGLTDDQEFKEFQAKAQAIRIVVDAGGGAATGYYKEFLEAFGFTVFEVPYEIGRPTRQILPEGPALERAKQALVEHKAHFAIVTDFDADRANTLPAVFNPAGEVIDVIEPSPQEVAAMNVALVLARRQTVRAHTGDARPLAVVVHDATSKRVWEIARVLEAKVFVVEVGEVNVLEKMRQLEKGGYDVVIGIEGANGGTVFRGDHPTFQGDTSRNGAMTALFTGIAAMDPSIGRMWLEARNAAARPNVTTVAVPAEPALVDLLKSLPGERGVGDWSFFTTPADGYGKRGDVPQELVIPFKEALETHYKELWPELHRIGLAGTGCTVSSYQIVHHAETEESIPYGPEDSAGAGLRVVSPKGTPFGEGGWTLELRMDGGRSAFLWLRGSLTEGMLRVAAEGQGPEGQVIAQALLNLFRSRLYPKALAYAKGTSAGLEEVRRAWTTEDWQEAIGDGLGLLSDPVVRDQFVAGRTTLVDLLSKDSRNDAAFYRGLGVLAELIDIYGHDVDRIAEAVVRIQGLIKVFEAKYGPGPVHLIRVPARIVLMGVHNDYNGGNELLMTLPEDTLAVVRPRGDSRVRLASTIPMKQPSAADKYPDVEFDIGMELEQVRQGLSPADRTDWNRILEKVGVPPAHWSNYVKGAFLYWQNHYSADKLHGADILFDSAVPIERGLSSSSLLVVAAGIALHQVNGKSWDPVQLVLGSGEAEWYVGTRGGNLDHAAAILGKRGHAVLVSPDLKIIRYVPVPDGYSQMVLDSLETADKTGGVRRLFNEISAEASLIGLEFLKAFLASQVRDGKEQILELKTLKEVLMMATRLGLNQLDMDRLIGRLPETVQTDHFERDLPPEFAGVVAGRIRGGLRRRYQYPNELAEPVGGWIIRKRVWHVIHSLYRTEQAVRALQKGDMKEFGDLMDADYASLRDNYGVVYGPRVGAASSTAWAGDGVLGVGWMSGFGGNGVALVKRGEEANFLQRMFDGYYKSVRDENSHFRFRDPNDLLQQKVVFPAVPTRGAGVIEPWLTQVPHLPANQLEEWVQHLPQEPSPALRTLYGWVEQLPPAERGALLRLVAKGYRLLGPHMDWAARHAVQERVNVRSNQSSLVQRKTDGSLVTAVDGTIQEQFNRLIQDYFPGTAGMGEEGDVAAEGARFLWVSDPLDGTSSGYLADSGHYLSTRTLLYRGDDGIYRPVLTVIVAPEIWHQGQRGLWMVAGLGVNGVFINGQLVSPPDSEKTLKEVLSGIGTFRDESYRDFLRQNARGVAEYGNDLPMFLLGPSLQDAVLPGLTMIRPDYPLWDVVPSWHAALSIGGAVADPDGRPFELGPELMAQGSAARAPGMVFGVSRRAVDQFRLAYRPPGAAGLEELDMSQWVAGWPSLPRQDQKRLRDRLGLLDRETLRGLLEYVQSPTDPVEAVIQLVSQALGIPIEQAGPFLASVKPEDYKSVSAIPIDRNHAVGWTDEDVRRLLEGTNIAIMVGGDGERLKKEMPQWMRDRLQQHGRDKKPTAMIGPSGTSPLMNFLNQLAFLAKQVGAKDVRVLLVASSENGTAVRKDVGSSKPRLKSSGLRISVVTQKSFPSFDPDTKKMIVVQKSGKANLLQNPSGTYGPLEAAYEFADKKGFLHGKRWLIVPGDVRSFTAEMLARILSEGSRFPIAVVGFPKRAIDDPPGGALTFLRLPDGSEIFLTVEMREQNAAFRAAQEEAIRQSVSYLNVGPMLLSAEAARLSVKGFSPPLRDAVRPFGDGSGRRVMKVERFITHIPTVVGAWLAAGSGKSIQDTVGILAIGPDEYWPVKTYQQLIEATEALNRFSRRLLANLPGGDLLLLGDKVYLEVMPGLKGLKGGNFSIAGSGGVILGPHPIGLRLVDVLQEGSGPPVFVDPTAPQFHLDANADGTITLPANGAPKSTAGLEESRPITADDAPAIIRGWADLTPVKQRDALQALRDHGVTLKRYRHLRDLILQPPHVAQGVFAGFPSFLDGRPGGKDYSRLLQDGTDPGVRRRQGVIIAAAGEGSRLLEAAVQQGLLPPDALEHYVKPTVPITPVVGKSTLQVQLETFAEEAHSYGVPLPVAVVIHEEAGRHVRELLEKNGDFGLPNLRLVVQGMNPVLDGDGLIVLKQDGSVAFNPDGTGGVVRAALDQELRQWFLHLLGPQAQLFLNNGDMLLNQEILQLVSGAASASPFVGLGYFYPTERKPDKPAEHRFGLGTFAVVQKEWQKRVAIVEYKERPQIEGLPEAVEQVEAKGSSVVANSGLYVEPLQGAEARLSVLPDHVQRNRDVVGVAGKVQKVERFATDLPEGHEPKNVRLLMIDPTVLVPIKDAPALKQVREMAVDQERHEAERLGFLLSPESRMEFHPAARHRIQVGQDVRVEGAVGVYVDWDGLVKVYRHPQPDKPWEPFDPQQVTVSRQFVAEPGQSILIPDGTVFSAQGIRMAAGLEQGLTTSSFRSPMSGTNVGQSGTMTASVLQSSRFFRRTVDQPGVVEFFVDTRGDPRTLHVAELAAVIVAAEGWKIRFAGVARQGELDQALLRFKGNIGAQVILQNHVLTYESEDQYPAVRAQALQRLSAHPTVIEQMTRRTLAWFNAAVESAGLRYVDAGLEEAVDSFLESA